MEEKFNNKRNVIFNPNKVQKWNEEENTIVAVTPDYIDALVEPFTYLRKTSSEGYSSMEEVETAKEVMKKERLVRVKKLEFDKKAGYVGIGMLTVITSLVVGTLIFLLIGSIIGGR